MVESDLPGRVRGELYCDFGSVFRFGLAAALRQLEMLRTLEPCMLVLYVSRFDGAVSSYIFAIDSGYHSLRTLPFHASRFITFGRSLCWSRIVACSPQVHFHLFSVTNTSVPSTCCPCMACRFSELGFANVGDVLVPQEAW